jgi:hypothetical protein
LDTVNFYKLDNISLKSLSKIVSSLEQSFGNKVIENYNCEILKGIVYIVSENYHTKGYAIVYHKNSYYYLDKLWIEHSEKHKKYGKHLFKYLLDVYKEKLIWRTNDIKNKEWYCRESSVRCFAYNKKYYYLTNTHHHMWTYDDIYILNKRSSFI